jgi:hypothetical protein
MQLLVLRVEKVCTELRVTQAWLQRGPDRPAPPKIIPKNRFVSRLSFCRQSFARTQIGSQ